MNKVILNEIYLKQLGEHITNKKKSQNYYSDKHLRFQPITLAERCDRKLVKYVKHLRFQLITLVDSCD